MSVFACKPLPRHAFRFPCENAIAPQPTSTVKCHINDMHKSYVLRSS